MTTETTNRTWAWEIYEHPRKGAEETTALFEWSRNYEAGKTPATAFLSLIGYGEEEWGDAIQLPKGLLLAYMELDYLADALKEYASNPDTVNEAIAELLEAESNE